MIITERISKKKTKVIEAVYFQPMSSFSAVKEISHNNYKQKYTCHGSDMKPGKVDFMLTYRPISTPEFYVNGLKIHELRGHMTHANSVSYNKEENSYYFYNYTPALNDLIAAEYITKDEMKVHNEY